MVIGIDIRVLGNPVKSGIEEYAENLIPNLIKEGKGITFKLFYSSCQNSLSDYGWLNESNVKLYKFNYPNKLLFTSSRVFKKPCVDRMVGGADVFFFPHFFISALSAQCKRVTTFHDLSFIHFPELITLRKRIWHNLQMCPEWQARYSDKIISVSESTKMDLINFYKIDLARIEVIYSGVTTSNVQRPFDVANPSDVVNFKRARNLPDRFILFLGKIEPRKNIVSIVKAFNNLKLNPKYKDVGLVIAGARGWLYEDILKEANVRTSDVVNNQIIFTDQLNDEERSLYYRAADIFVYPSFFEGFGFPPLEAMSCGTPVITSRNSSIPEVVGNSAVMIDPYDTNELELWLVRLLEDKELKKALIVRGRAQAQFFSWKRSAQKTLECLVR